MCSVLCQFFLRERTRHVICKTSCCGHSTDVLYLFKMLNDVLNGLLTICYKEDRCTF